MNKKYLMSLALCCCLSASACDHAMLDEHPVQEEKALFEILYAMYLTLPQTTVSGRVVLCSINKNGNPNVKVTLAGIFETRTVYTDTNGNFSIDNVRTSNYTISASKQGFQFIPDSQNITVSSSGLNNINFMTSITWDIKIIGEPDGWISSYAASQTNDCGYIVVGSSDESSIGDLDFYIVKLDMLGNIMWKQKIDGGEKQTDVAYSVLQNPDGTYIAAGSTFSYSKGKSNVMVVKLDVDAKNGQKIWSKTYGNLDGYWDEARSISLTSDNGYILTGGSNFSVLKLDANGTQLWTYTSGGGSADKSMSIQETPNAANKGYIVCGTTTTETGNHSAMIVKIDADGNVDSNGTISWPKLYSNKSNNEGNDIQVTSDGGYIFGGYTGDNFGKAWIVKLDADGNKTWDQVYGLDTYMNTFNSISKTIEGDYLAAGFTYSFDRNFDDMLIMKIDASGNVIWQKTYYTEGDSKNYANSISQTSDGGIIICGTTTISQGREAAWILKLNQEGNIIQ